MDETAALQKGRRNMNVNGMRLLTATLLAGLTLAGGCVSKQKYDDVWALNRKAQEELSKCRQQNDELRTKNDDLLAKLANQETRFMRQKEVIENLEEANRQLNTDFKDLHQRYLKLLKGDDVPQIGSIRVLPQELDLALKAFAADNPDLVEYFPRRGMLKFKSDLTFEKGSDFVTDEAETALQKFAKVFGTDVADKFHVYVAGHTDDIPIKKPSTKQVHPNNWYLSLHRAVAVQQVLTGAGIQGDRIGVMGFGKFHPIAPNKPNNGGNPLNRRVELWVVPPDRYLTTEADLATKEDTDTNSGESK
ncbi:MAG: OmpA family protein [Phycisphaerae bacterium]